MTTQKYRQEVVLSWHLKKKAFEIITEICTENFNSSEYKNPVEIAFEMMKHPDFPMHDYSHYLVPAVLLTAFRKKGQ